MPKKIKIEGTVLEDYDYYTVIKPADAKDSLVTILVKEVKDPKTKEILVEEGHWPKVKNYKIIGSAALLEFDSYKSYQNELNWQLIGRGAHRCYSIEIDDWKTKKIKGKEETRVVYHDDYGRKYVRYIDEEGNFYKKQKQTKQVQEDVATI